MNNSVNYEQEDLSLKLNGVIILEVEAFPMLNSCSLLIAKGFKSGGAVSSCLQSVFEPYFTQILRAAILLTILQTVVVPNF